MFTIFILVFMLCSPLHGADELDSLPFNTDKFDETAMTDLEDPIKQRLKMRANFDKNGPPGIGVDIFDEKVIDENVRLASVASLYEGSAEAVESNESESDEVPEPSQNSTIQTDQTFEYSSNSSLLFDQNTSDSSNEKEQELQAEKAANVLVEKNLENDIKKNITSGETLDKSESLKTCPPPKICGDNCFVSINEDGCQDCQCLWESANCETNEDCNEENHQFCDLGKCNCRNGFRQNMKLSGQCEADPEFMKSYDMKTIDFHTDHRSKRFRRAAKPRRSERLEWPGVCDKNEHCPPNLVCIHGDCWSVPERAENVILSGKTNRFVSEDELTRRTTTTNVKTWFPPTTTTLQPTEVPPEIPITVDKFHIIETTTPTIVLNDNKFENLQQRKDNFLGDFGDEWNEVDQSHVKKIHLETEAPPLINEKKRKKKKSKKSRKTTTTPTPEVIDDIEFPISSKIKNDSKRPRALSAEPTREELKDHKKLVEIFNLHELQSFNEEFTTFAIPTFQTSNVDYDTTAFLETTTPKPLDFFQSSNEDNSGENQNKPFIVGAQKFQQIPVLQNVSGDMSSDDPPETTPEPAAFEQHQYGLWYPMKKGDIPHLGIFGGEFRRAPKKIIRTANDLRLYNEYTKLNRRNKPIRIEMDNAGQYIQNECQNDNDCSTYHNTICCTKKWCDRTNNCGVGKFCLPNCDSTKLTFLPSINHAEGIIDIMYD